VHTIVINIVEAIAYIAECITRLLTELTSLDEVGPIWCIVYITKLISIN